MLFGLGVLSGDPPVASTKPTRFVGMSASGYLHSPIYGLFESYVDLGAEVETGQPLGCVYPFDELERAPVVLESPHPGIMIFRRTPTMCKRGDFLVGVATEIERASLLEP